ncbi:hypothetical protein BCR44DRAFT_35958 [Catenaria anguillulae PL171]|uniref:Uncharacterized protein n=1 Tax=Catenaria anguillulae PL171 TaxID=765915 RepID=A0A1Y2HH03_9FUNG|nr:hypothetical protein BCR44DRAFT_35958 [Catenaria anguillulae PL171]
MERKTGIVLAWIAVSILVLLAFTVLIFAPGPLKRTPLTFDNAIFTLLLKLFTAAVSMAISGVTDIIATRDNQ